MSFSPSLGRWLQQDPIGYTGGAMNLYQMVNNDPINADDPSGLTREETEEFKEALRQYQAEQREKELARERVGENGFGSFYFRYSPPTGASTAMTAIPYFMPTAKACCDEIAFIQVVRSIDLGTGKPFGSKQPSDKEGWHVDNNPDVPYGWYGYGGISNRMIGSLAGLPGFTTQSGVAMALPLMAISGVPQPGEVNPLYRGQSGFAWLGDKPDLVFADRKQEFITCAVCRTGKSAGAIYGCIKWGQQSDVNGKWSLLKPEFISWPGKPFFSAIQAWNAADNKYPFGKFFDPSGAEHKEFPNLMKKAP